jgi:HEAT repeat protein
MPSKDENVALPPYILELIDPDRFVRWAAAEKASIYADDILRCLIRLLNVEELDWWTLNTLAYALRKLGLPVVQVLLLALKDERPRVRVRAATLLGFDQVSRPIEGKNSFSGRFEPPIGSMGGRDVVDALLVALSDHNEDVRCWAAHALSKLAYAGGDGLHSGVVVALLEAFYDSARLVRVCAIDTVHDIVHAGKLGAHALDCSFVFQPMLALLQDKDPSVRCSAIRALGQMDDMRAFQPVREALKDENEYVRESAIDTLMVLGKDQAAQPLLQLLYSELDPRMRMVIISALSKLDMDLDTNYSLDPCLRALRDPDSEVREFSAHVLALMEVSDARIIPALTEAYSRETLAETKERIGEALEKLRSGAE